MSERHDHWIRAGALLAPDGTVQADRAIHVRDGLIVEVVDGAAAPADAFHAPEGTLVPGLVDAHTHLSFGYGPDHEVVRSTAEQASLDDLREQVRVRAAECLRGGVTTIRDCGDRDFVTIGVRDEVAAGRTAGPRILAAGPPVTTPGGHLNWCGGAIDPDDDLEAAIDRLHEAGVDHVKVLASGGGMTAESDPHHPQFSREQLTRLIRRAADHGLPVAAHAHSSDSIALAVAAGARTIEHCSWKGVDGSIELRLDVVEQIARDGIAITVTMAGIQRALLPGSTASPDEREGALASSATGDLRDDFAWAREMRARGCDLLLASDAGVRFTPFEEFVESIRCGIVGLDLTAAEALVLASTAPARAIGLGDVTGALCEGLAADVVLLDGLLTDTSRELPAVAEVWAAGRRVARTAASA